MPFGPEPAKPSAPPTPSPGDIVVDIPTWLVILVKEGRLAEIIPLVIILVFAITFFLVDLVRPFRFSFGKTMIKKLQFKFRQIRSTNWLVMGTFIRVFAIVTVRVGLFLLTLYFSILNLFLSLQKIVDCLHFCDV